MFHCCLAQRSIHRPYHPEATLVTYWKDDPSKKWRLRDWHLEPYPVFHSFDRAFFEEHQLPEGPIPFRYGPECAVCGSTLMQLAEEFAAELMSHNRKKSTYKNVTILKKRDFNPITACGLIIARFNDYPFVIKLFIESPQMFVKPFSKGIEPCFIYILGGGINRYLSGFVRLKNLEKINDMIQASPKWRDRVDTPRKWFWQPQNNRWFIVEGHHMGKNGFETMEVPSVYGIICDAIDVERPLSIGVAEDRHIGMDLARYLGNRIDPHIPNLVFERWTGKVVIIDTEHFALQVGLKRKTDWKSYGSYFGKLMQKCMQNKYGKSKVERRALQVEDFSENIIT